MNSSYSSPVIYLSLVSYSKVSWILIFIPANIYFFKVNNRNTRATSVTSCWCFFCLLWTHFTTFRSVSIVDLERLNVSWDLHFYLLTNLRLVVVHIRTNLTLLAEGLSKYVHINFRYRQALIIAHEIRAKLFGINLGKKHVIYQTLINFM